MTELDEYWNSFLEKTNRDKDEKCAGDLFFEGKNFINAELNSIVLAGQKTAFFTTLATFTIDGEPLPVSGELYILVDNQNKPLCILEMESVNIIPFNEVTWDMAQKEGECSTFGEWKEKMQEYIEDEGHVLGFDYSEDIKLVFQTFKVIYK